LLFLSPWAGIAQDAIPAGVTEQQVTFPTDGLEAPGTLTLPAQPRTELPIVVMVQGSGVQDRDATIGPNKVFQQIAWELAKRGIASLRYDRRVKFDPASFKAHPDLDHEVVTDAVSALAYVTTRSEVDATKVFYLGHSLGAQLGPDVVAAREAEKPGSVHGMLLLSGIARPINVVLLEQIETIGKLQGATPEQLAAFETHYEKLFAMSKDPSVPNSTPTGSGTTLGYWRDWMKRDPLATLAKLKVPVLVLRGTNDMNSSHVDFELLRKAAPPGSASREFAGLNHEYFEGSGSGADAMKPNHVAVIAMDAIAAWIKTGKLE
jgi:dienelactone hydrolase